MKYTHVLFILLIPFALLAGCVSPHNPLAVTNEKEENGFEQVTSLFETTGETNGEQTVRFHTNDTRYWSEYGYTVWTVWGADKNKPFTDRTVKLSKPKGFVSACYGMVLCHTQRLVDGKMVDTMLTVMINNEGQYALGKVIGGRYESLLDLTFSPLLEAGLGAPNTVRVTYSNNEFSLYLNGVLAQTFIDTKEPVHYSGRDGYIVVIAPMDFFPENEVDVYFTE